MILILNMFMEYTEALRYLLNDRILWILLLLVCVGLAAPQLRPSNKAEFLGLFILWGIITFLFTIGHLTIYGMLFG